MKLKIKTTNGSMRIKHFAASGAVIAAFALAASGCSPEEAKEKAYTVPSELCGTPIPQRALEPLLPPGDELTTRKAQGMSDSYIRCSLNVDEKYIISSRIDWEDKGETIIEVAKAHWEPRFTQSLQGVSNFEYSGLGGISAVKCANPELEHRKNMQLYVSVAVRDGKERAKEDIKTLLLAYQKSVGESTLCRRKAS